MSERVSERDTLIAATVVTSLAEEVRQWRAMGESPEAVRAELMWLHRIAADHGVSSADRMGREPAPMNPPTREDYFKGTPSKRPSFAEALEREVAASMDSTARGGLYDGNRQKHAALNDLLDAIRSARRASGE